MESWEDLALWRTQLIEEEEFIIKILAEIDEQINCLQVEQMEIADSMREKEVEEEKEEEESKTDAPKDETSQKLDLTIPAIKKNDTEEEEEEEEDEEDDL